MRSGIATLYQRDSSPLDGHADYASLHVDDGASLRGRAERQIKADETVDSSAAKTAPSRSRDCDDAEASDRRTFVISDCQHDVTRAERRRVGGQRHRQPVSIARTAGGAEVLNRMGHDYLARARQLDPMIEVPN
jgi:hypothetical protein